MSGQVLEVAQETIETKLERLWQDWWQTRSQQARNDLLLHYLYLVSRVVQRLFAESKHYHEQEDLHSCGVIGLMDALDRFQNDKGAKFETYARIRIRGEIIDYMRRQDWAPVHLRNKIRRIQQAYAQICQTEGLAATETQVAEHLGIPLSEVQQVLGDAYFLNVMNLEDDLTGVGPSYSLSSGTRIAEEYERKEQKEMLAQQISRLNDREQLILSLYYEEELTLKEIGSVLGVSESRISQIHSAIVIKLRNMLNDQGVF